MSTKLYNKNYTEFNGRFQLILPLNYEVLIPKDDSVRLLSQILEGLNYQKLYTAYASGAGRKPAVDPKILFKVLTYAYMNNIYSSRKIETACRRDINFMWLLNGKKAPDHSTIARFRKDYLSDAVEDLFYQMVAYLNQIGEVNFENLFVDGTKIEANANRYTFVWKKVVNKNEAKMYVKIQSCISEENYLYLEGKKQTYYIKPQTYEKWKTKSFKNDISKRENMAYDSKKDEYTCHNGKRLKPIGSIRRTSATGYCSLVTIYECENCLDCPYRAKCTKAKGNRQMQVSKKFIQKRQVSYENITSKEGILLRVNRSIQVEGAFGVLKDDYNFHRFFTRGKISVKNEFILLCFGYNVNKLHAKIQNERVGNPLHQLKTAV